jgi:hypothetical protein
MRSNSRIIMWLIPLSIEIKGYPQITYRTSLWLHRRLSSLNPRTHSHHPRLKVTLQRRVEESQYLRKTSTCRLTMKWLWMIRCSDRFMRTVYAQPCSPSPSSPETIPKTIRRFRSPIPNTQRVRYIMRLCLCVEKKTIVFDIDETLVYAV